MKKLIVPIAYILVLHLSGCTVLASQYIRNDTNRELTVEQWSHPKGSPPSSGGSEFNKTGTYIISPRMTCRFMYTNPDKDDEYFFISNSGNDQTTNVKLISEDQMFVITELDSRQTLSIYKTDEETESAFSDNFPGCKHVD